MRGSFEFLQYPNIMCRRSWNDYYEQQQWTTWFLEDTGLYKNFQDWETTIQHYIRDRSKGMRAGLLATSILFLTAEVGWMLPMVVRLECF
jgi:hypothetical protein